MAVELVLAVAVFGWAAVLFVSEVTEHFKLMHREIFKRVRASTACAVINQLKNGLLVERILFSETTKSTVG
jgi:hypothetical protein